MQQKIHQVRYLFHLSFFMLMTASVLYSCQSSTNNAAYAPPPPEALPVITISNMPSTTYQEYSASLEGSNDIEVRPQIDGYIDRIMLMKVRR